MDETLRPIKNVLVATGLTTESVGGVLVAKDLARRLGAACHAVHVIEPISEEEEEAIPGLADAHIRHAEEELEQFARTHGLRDCAELHVARGDPAEEVLKYRRELDADLLVLGRYGRGGLKRGMLGSIADRLVRKSQACVLVVPPEFRGEFKTIGVASDLSEEALPGIRRAIDLAQRLEIPEVVLLHTYSVPRGYHTVLTWEEACEKLEAVSREKANKAIQAIRDEIGDSPSIRIEVAQGVASGTIPKLADEQKLDLLVMSTHGRSTAALLLLGRTTEKVLRDAPCAVWAEKSPKLFQGFLDAMKELLK